MTSCLITKILRPEAPAGAFDGIPEIAIHLGGVEMVWSGLRRSSGISCSNRAAGSTQQPWQGSEDSASPPPVQGAPGLEGISGWVGLGVRRQSSGALSCPLLSPGCASSGQLCWGRGLCASSILPPHVDAVASPSPLGSTEEMRQAGVGLRCEGLCTRGLAEVCFYLCFPQ